MVTYAISYVTESKVFFVGIIGIRSRRTTNRENILDRVFTDSNFIRTLGLIDNEWWYNTDRLVVSLYR